MDRFSAVLGITALFSGLGLVYLSRFLLRKYPKLTGEELENRDAQLEGVHRTYRISNTITLLGVGLFLFLLYQFNRAFWEERVVVLFIPIFAVYALFDGLFAIRTKVFPTTTRSDLNSFVYDSENKLRWIAFWQIGLSILLLGIDCVVLFSTL